MKFTPTKRGGGGEWGGGKSFSHAEGGGAQKVLRYFFSQ